MNKLLLIGIILISVLVLFIGGVAYVRHVVYPTTPPANVQKETITVDGYERIFYTHIPQNAQGSLPVIIVLHGGFGNARRMIDLTRGELTNLSDERGFIVIYPEGLEEDKKGTGGHWNDGRNVKDYPAQRDNVDDVKFIDAMIDWLVKNKNVNSSRVFVTGISNGGLMSYRLGCESSKIRAIAPVAGSIPKNVLSLCNPPRPISVLAFSGDADPLVDYNGGIVGSKQGEDLGEVLSVEESVKYFADVDGCSENPTITDIPDNNADDETTSSKEEFTNCVQNTSVILYTIHNGGHTWPGGWQYAPEVAVGKTSRDINANQIMVDFFLSQ